MPCREQRSVTGEGPPDGREGRKGIREGFLEVVRAELLGRGNRGCGTKCQGWRATPGDPLKSLCQVRHLGSVGARGRGSRSVLKIGG